MKPIAPAGLWPTLCPFRNNYPAETTLCNLCPGCLCCYSKHDKDIQRLSKKDCPNRFGGVLFESKKEAK